MAKRVAVQLVADGNAFVATTEKTLGTMRQQFAAAGREINREFAGTFKAGAGEAERAIRASMAQIENLTKSANLTNGALRFDKSALTAELTNAKQYLATQQQVAAALDRVAIEESQAGAAVRVRVEAQRLSIAATEEQVRGIQQEIALLDRLQGEIGQTTVQQRRLAAVNGEARQGMQQLSYQVADVASGFASGISPMQIFAQQGTQVIQSLQLMTTKTTGLIGFLAGPWGLVITAAATILGSLAVKLWESSEAATSAAMASNGLSDAQSALGQMFNLTTGKIKAQNEMLRMNIQLTAMNLRAEAMAAKSTAEEGLTDAGQRSWSAWFSAKRPGAARTVRDTAARKKLLGVINGTQDGSEVLKWAERADFSGVDIDRDEYVAAVRAAFEARAKSAIADKIDETMKAGVLATEFRQPGSSRTRKGPEGVDPAKVAETMSNKLGEAYEKAVQLRGQFDAMPSDIDRANNALIDAQQLIAQAQKALADPKATTENRKKAEDVLRVATEAQRLAQAAPSEPFADNLEAMREQIDAQRLIIGGRTDEYHMMQDMTELARQLGAESIAQIPAMIAARGINQDKLDLFYRQRAELRLQTYELQRQQEEEQKLLGFVENREEVAKQAIYDVLDGRGVNAFKDAIRSLGEIARREMTEQVFKAVFGDHFEKQKLKILGLDKVDASGKRFAASIDKTVPPIIELGNAAMEAAQKLRSASIAANDNGVASPKSLAKMAGADSWPLGDIIVSAPHPKENNGLNELKKLTKTTSDGLGKNGSIAKGIGGFGDMFSGALRGAAYGEAASGMLKSLGMKSSKTGGQIGGAIGSLIPIPGADIAGAFIGSAIGGLFKKTPKGSSTITSISEDASFSGSKKLRESVGALASGVQGSLADIANALGADVGGFAVSIGQRKKKFTVDPTGKGRTKGSGVLSFASEEEAVMAALRDALADGAIRGISAASQRIIQNGGKDLQKAVEKAVLIESIPKLLKARTNPVAAALDDLNDKWDRTVAALKEGAASAEQFADAEKLYKLERDEIMKAANDNLKSFINGLNFGPSSGLSLRDQSANARKELQPYLEAIAAGNIAGIDRDKYLEAADSFLQISRALNGSGAGYFSTVDELRKATQSLLDQSVAGAKDAEARDPFGKATAKNTQDMANILDGHTDQLKQIGDYLRAIAGGGGGDPGFIGGGRNFVNFA